MTVYHLENTMSVSELMAWSTYFRNEPPDIQEMQMAVLSNMISSYMGNKKSKYANYLIRKPKQVEDKAISNDAILAVFQSLGAK